MPVSPATGAALLAYAAATDNREVTEEAARAWADVLDDTVTLRDGKAAIIAHRRSSTDYLMPIHVNTEVRRIRRTRTDAIAADEIPPAALDHEPARALTWTREYRRAIGDGEAPDAATKRACDAVGVAAPLQLPTAPRPEAVKRLMAGHTATCGAECGCLTRPVRKDEGAA
jgi:hypothetical protein